MRRPFLSVHTIAVSAIFIALGVILSFLKIPLTAVTELTFTGVPIAAGACLFGPAVGCVIGALIDVCGFLAKPAGPFFPGFTVSAGLVGVCYGLLLNRRWWERGAGQGLLRRGKTGLAARVVLAHLLKTLAVSLGLNCFWLGLYFGLDFRAVLIASAPKEALNFPFEAFLIYSVVRVIQRIQPAKEPPHDRP